MTILNTQGIIFILSSPSGGGKTTTAELVLQTDKNIVRSISATTRPPRAGEVHGQDYFFYSEPEFQTLIQEDKILEYATVFGNYYGTPQQYVQNILAEGKDILCCIDWQGERQIINKMQAVTIFLLPPSLQELRNRLQTRSSDSQTVINNRLQEAREEILHCCHYDYVIINDNLADTVQTVQAIIMSERAKVRNKADLAEYLDCLRQDDID